jgi:hypothetical protein
MTDLDFMRSTDCQRWRNRAVRSALVLALVLLGAGHVCAGPIEVINESSAAITPGGITAEIRTTSYGPELVISGQILPGPGPLEIMITESDGAPLWATDVMPTREIDVRVQVKPVGIINGSRIAKVFIRDQTPDTVDQRQRAMRETYRHAEVERGSPPPTRSSTVAKPDLDPKFGPIVASFCIPKMPAVDCFAHAAGLMYAMCGLTAELAIAEGNPDRSSRCNTEARTHLAPPFERARRETAKNKDAADLLKDSYAYWLTVMNELMPKYDEVRLIYRQRLARQKETLDHKLNRLKLEK